MQPNETRKMSNRAEALRSVQLLDPKLPKTNLARRKSTILLGIAHLKRRALQTQAHIRQRFGILI